MRSISSSMRRHVPVSFACLPAPRSSVRCRSPLHGRLHERRCARMDHARPIREIRVVFGFCRGIAGPLRTRTPKTLARDGGTEIRARKMRMLRWEVPIVLATPGGLAKGVVDLAFGEVNEPAQCRWWPKSRPPPRSGRGEVYIGAEMLTGPSLTLPFS